MKGGGGVITTYYCQTVGTCRCLGLEVWIESLKFRVKGQL